MSGLFDSLAAASNALNAQRAGLDVVGQNLANVNTVGYTRRVIDLAEVPPTDPLSAGRGVEVVQIQALRDAYVEARIRREQQGQASNNSVVDALSEVEGAVGAPGDSLDASITSFFNSFSTLANDVTSAPARDGVVAQGRALAQGFNDLSARLTESQRNADTSIGAAVDEINRLAAQVAQLNGEIANRGPDLETLRDQRGVALARLAELAGVDVIERQDGLVDVTIGQGHALVIGANGYTVDAAAAPPSGFLRLSSGGADITGQITSGTVGGLLSVRDTIVPGYLNNLDQLAFDFAAQVNALHQTGFDATGAAGGDFFAPLATVAGAAANLSVDPAVAADSGRVAASATGAAGDNQIARAIAGLRDARVMSGGTATASQAWARFAYTVGLDITSARSASDTHTSILQQLQQLRDQTSGVSMDEEAAQLMRFQRAYEANARYFSTIVDTIDAVLNMVQ
jgi:flagellar hook-associated protein 1 FlgK